MTRTNSIGAGSVGPFVGFCMILLGLIDTQVLGQVSPASGGDTVSRSEPKAPFVTGGFGTLVPADPVNSDPRKVREQLSESLKSAMHKLVEAEKKPISEQRSLLIDSAVDWDRASTAADKTAQAEAKSAAELQKHRDALKDANHPTFESLEQFNKAIGEVRQQLGTVKQSAERARQDAVDSPESPMKQAAAKQWFRQQRQIELMAANLESLHAAVTQPAIAAQSHLMLLEGLIQVHTVQANSLRLASNTFRSTAKAQRVMADVLKIEAANGNEPVLSVGDLSEGTVNGPPMSPTEERDFAAWLQGKTETAQRNG